MTTYNQNKNQKSSSPIACKRTSIVLNGIIFLILSSFLLNGCTEPYILETNTYEEALVVEATITNELKKQEITLTKTARFEDKEIQIEKGAKVFITDNTGIQYDFKEESGKYISTTEFQAVSGKEYRLNIKTSDGRTFESSTETLTPINAMQEVKAAVETKDSLRGVGIRVSSYDPTNTAKYYRYEYEETYKIIAPKWVPSKSIALTEFTIGIIPNPTNTRICYSTKKNTELLLTNTNNLNEARLNFLVRFVSDQNYIITHRYSILVKQYVESLASYTYYTTLKKISGSGSILYPTQPGFINGNVKSVNNENDKIIGFFDVASVSSKRIYFNYEELFPGELAPPYYTNCDQDVYPLCFGPDPCRGADLIQGIELNKLAYQFHEGINYHMVNIECGDCTSFSSNIKPLFWED
ncbi:DUF4249 domain-containing protein [Flavobacterium aquariorum]|uniref:DUF4249 domain-containing protein n=1 Tax=Flavobacterium aquariorum TaxID=2217670 RepID=A0A2W7TT35_9FLAO|nr:DUF4249 domain-containing protein [Flavobacterium aquariorum]PZX93713.1 DUF4249 domain-containing protein [Flavobacterium aquariorum]